MIRSFLALAILAALATPGMAIKQFQIQFLKKYADGTNEEYTELAKDAKCYLCHQGKKKKNRNPYGEALHEFLDKKKDKKDVDKIIASLEKVAEMHSVEGDESSPTFGELIADGKLPGGTLEDSKKEPGEE